jgi:hypothetical protein
MKFFTASDDEMNNFAAIPENKNNNNPQSTFKATLSILFTSKGLLFQNRITVTKKENLTLFFKEKTNGTAKVTIGVDQTCQVPIHPIDPINLINPVEFFVVISDSFLSFSIPDVLLYCL